MGVGRRQVNKTFSLSANFSYIDLCVFVLPVGDHISGDFKLLTAGHHWPWET